MGQKIMVKVSDPTFEQLFVAEKVEGVKISSLPRLIQTLFFLNQLLFSFFVEFG